ncbi:MAG: sigma-54-dependent transcriptional regulator [Planctomycetota bacterium]|jgi:DNA-binding NtrC family response regulator
MKWEELELHFRGETQQDAPPFGEGVIEWDYSRYTRALGLGRTPGLDTLKRRGGVVAAGRQNFRDELADQIGEWSKEKGWRLIRLSATPSTVVPDPVIYHLGVEITHPDSLIFCGAGQQGRPAIGKRPRSPAMRIPLSPTERWLIAADRVRRRVRAESAMQGLVLFIDNAEMLTPSALSILSYFLDTHCAWKAHLLSAPAKIYTVFATQARHEEWFREILGRFSPRTEPFVVRESIGPKKHRRMLSCSSDVECDHVRDTARSIGSWLARDELLGLLGPSASRCIDLMVRDGTMRQRAECGQVSVSADCGDNSHDHAPSHRVQVALDHVLSDPAPGASFKFARRLARMRIRGRGADNRRFIHESSRLGYSSMLVSPVFAIKESLSAGVGQVHSESLLDHLGAFLAAVAMRRDEIARKHARAMCAFSIDSERQLLRVIDACLSIGRMNCDRVIPAGFWPSLRCQAEISSYADVLCVLAEMTLSVRHMHRDDALDRWRFVAKWVGATELAEIQSGGRKRVSSVRRRLCHRLVALLTRSWIYVLTEHTETALWPLGSHQPALDLQAVPTGDAPAFLVGTIAYACGTSCVVEAGGRRWAGQFAFVRDMLSTSGNVFDLRIPTSAWSVQFSMDSRLLLAAPLLDETLLLLDPVAHPKLFAIAARHAQSFSGPRESLVTSMAMLYQGKRSRASGLSPSALDYIGLAGVLLEIGELSTAREVLTAAADLAPRDFGTSCMLFAVWCRVGLESLDPDWLRDGIKVLARHKSVVGDAALPILRALSASSTHFLRGRFQRAAEVARDAIVMSDGCRVARVAAVKRALVNVSLKARRACSLLSPGCRRGTASRIAAVRRSLELRPEVRLREILRSEDQPTILIPLLERLLAGQEQVGDELVLRLAISLHRYGQISRAWRGRGVDEALARIAPRFHIRLVRAIDDLSGVRLGASPAVSIPRGLLAGIDLAVGDYIWGDLPEPRSRRRGRQEFRLGLLQSARGACRVWPEDPALWRRIQLEIAGGTRDLIELRLQSAGWIGRRVSLECRRMHHVAISSSGKGSSRWIVRSLTRVGLATSSHDSPVGVGIERRTSKPTSPIGDKGRRSPVEVTAEPEWIGASDLSQKLLDTVRRAARSPFPVPLIGESGTGKGLIAKMIHRWSRASQAELVTADCASVVEELVETELFGHTRGAFTGAHQDHDGLITRAHRGTLFLDEVDTSGPRLQACLLRVLETGEYRPVGDSSTRESSFRVVCAALPRLDRLVDTGEFRQDLYYRLSALIVRIPPLRDRLEDVGPIARAEAGRLGLEIDDSAIEKLKASSWPGNVRELLHCIRRASLSAFGGAIRAADVSGQASGGSRHQILRSTRADPARVLTKGDLVRSVHSLLEEQSQFGTADFMRETGLSRRTAQRRLAQMVLLGIVRRVGAGRATRYVVCAGATSSSVSGLSTAIDVRNQGD